MVVARLVKVELAEDLANVCLDCPGGDDEAFRNGVVGAAFRHEAEYLSFALGQSVERLLLSRVGEKPGHDRRIEHALAVGDSLQAVDKNCDVGDAFFQQVAATVGVLLEVRRCCLPVAAC